MPYATTDDGVKLYYEEVGTGTPIIFVHEFAADHRSWETQMRHFGQRHRCITYGARGYPPSDIPETPAGYSQARATDDILAVKKHLGEHSALGSANTQIGCQGQRPSLYDLVEGMRKMTTPTLILTGDEDWPCLAPSVMMKREIPTSALSVMPNCGHTINLEDPDLFNQIVGDFIVQVDCVRWPKRDPRAMANSITGMKS